MVIAHASVARASLGPALDASSPGQSNAGIHASNDKHGSTVDGKHTHHSDKPLPISSQKNASNTDKTALNQAKQEVLNVLAQKRDANSPLESALKALEKHNKALTVNENTLDKQLFKRLPARLQGLFALGLISDKNDSRAQVIVSALASARQVQQLLPLLQQGKSFTSADFIRQPPSLLKLEMAGGHQLLTVSREPIAKGAWVSLRLESNGALKVNALSEPEKTSPVHQALNSKSSIGKSPLSSQPQVIIQKALRESLPQQQNLRDVLGHIRNLSQHLNQLPKEHNLFSASSRLLIDQLADKLPNIKLLSHGSGVKQAIIQSGVTQEAKLANLVKEISDMAVASPGAQSATTQTGSLHQSTALAPALNDVKTLLGRLAQALRNDIQLSRASSATGGPATTASTAGSTTAGNPLSSLNTPIGKLLDLLFNPQADITSKSHTALLEQFKQLQAPQRRLLREQINQKLLTLSQAGLAKVQTQQLQMLSEPVNGVLQRWLMELPFSHQGEVRSIELEIQQRESKKKNPQGELHNQWQLRLNIDLKALGKLQADIKLMAERGNIQLWFSNTEALQLAEAKLETLRQTLTRKGLELEELRCHQGVPPKLETSLQCQLINTRA
ncbi:flagellar hook-length control protein FliK [Pseudoteredinibacter isoporae]|uniref:flagellar hook-length control protein FliK n=1 Tax=Pseudoteredinibacter isoporae TaxID=570281 RepID=UPI00310735DC